MLISLSRTLRLKVSYQGGSVIMEFVAGMRNITRVSWFQADEVTREQVSHPPSLKIKIAKLEKKMLRGSGK